MIPTVNAEPSKANPQSIEKTIQKGASFKILFPHNLSRNWTVQIVSNSSPLNIKRSVDSIRLHYFDKNHKYMLGITQFKVTSNIITHEDIRQDASGQKIREKLYVRNHEGRFTSFLPKRQPCSLWWVEDNTYIGIDSPVLTKQEILKIAESMK